MRSRSVYTQIREPDKHFSACYEDNAILIQFIIVEFVQIHQLTSQLKLLIDKYLENSAVDNSHEIGTEFKQTLGQLIDIHPQNSRSSHSKWTKGSLAKLKEYCEQFSCNSSHQSKQHIDLHMATHQALLHAIHTQELLNRIILNPYVQSSEVFLQLDPVKRSFNNLLGRINQVIRFLPRVFAPFWDNENVLLCLLRIREPLGKIYGDDFLQKKFKWPAKAQGLVPFLVNRYKERGFESLIPTIQQVADS